MSIITANRNSSHDRTGLFTRHCINGYRLAEKDDLTAGNQIYWYGIKSDGTPEMLKELVVDAEPVRADFGTGRTYVQFRNKGQLQTVEQDEVIGSRVKLKSQEGREKEAYLLVFYLVKL